MKRYLTRRPRSADYDKGPDAETYLARTVFEPDPAPFETGLLDAFGAPLFAAYEMDVIGFIRR
jgi:hypothetical protein